MFKKQSSYLSSLSIFLQIYFQFIFIKKIMIINSNTVEVQIFSSIDLLREFLFHCVFFLNKIFRLN